MAEETTALNYVREGGEGEIIEKKSRFICTVRPVETEEEAVAFIAEMKKKYWDARHNCSAFVLGDRQELTRCSDDGEPAGTAGRPMLEVLLGRGIHNAAVVVTRYFGGVLLGTGGLVRAYTEAAKLALEDAGLKEVCLQSRLFIQVPYADWGTIQYILQQAEVESMKEEYGADVCTEIRLPVEKEKALADAIREKTAARVMVEKIGEEIA